MQNPYNRYQSNQQQAPAAKKSKKPKAVKQPKPGVKRAKKKSIEWNVSWPLLSLCCFGALLSFYIIVYTDDFLDVINRIEIGVTQSMAEEAPAASGQRETLPVGKVTHSNTSTDQLVMKNTNVYKALKDKRRELEKKERRLEQLEEELEIQKAEVEKQLKDIQAMRVKISEKLDRKVASDEKNVNKLVGVYSSMKPQNAAVIITSLDEELAVQILKKMKKQNAAEILNYIAPKKAQVLSEKFTGLHQ